MTVHFPKIVDIDLDKSKFNEDGGNFYFKLDQPVEERWQQAFRDAAQQEQAQCFYVRQPAVVDGLWIVAYAGIEGENDIKTVSDHLKHAVVVANVTLKETVDAEIAAERKKQQARKDLEQKVKRIIGDIDFK